MFPAVTTVEYVHFKKKSATLYCVMIQNRLSYCVVLFKISRLGMSIPWHIIIHKLHVKKLEKN